MDYTQEQFDKLPKWAQNKLLQIESENKFLQSKLDVYERKKETNVAICEGLGYSYLPENSRIEFRTGKNNENSVTVYVRSDGNIDINTDSRLGETTVILPRASNSFYVTFVKL